MTVWRRPTRCGRKARLRRVTFVAWARAVETGSPWENDFAESFFSRLRDELLNCEEFENLPEARWFARRRKEEHNKERPHSRGSITRYSTRTPITPGTENGAPRPHRQDIKAAITPQIHPHDTSDWVSRKVRRDLCLSIRKRGNLYPSRGMRIGSP